MSAFVTRRRFLQAATVGGATLAGSNPDRAAAAPDKAPDIIRFGSDIEPIVRLIEETPRDKCPAVLVEQLRGGLPYRRFLAAIFLAAMRRHNPHHAAYKVFSVYQVSQDLRHESRLLPLFWAVDGFKRQVDAVASPPIERLTGTLPAAEKAAAEFHDAMQRRDAGRAERAAVALARGDGARHAYDAFWQYGCRDISLIGHRAISVTSCWRTLETIGWQHAEPVLRFVVTDLHLRGGGPDSFYAGNLARVDRVLANLPPGWAVGRTDRGATLELSALLRQGQSEQACDLAAKQLAGPSGAQPVWDALHVAAAELLLLHANSTGMNGRPLHVNTAVNALHFAFNTSMAPRIRLLILLQAVAWVPEFLRIELGQELAPRGLFELEGAKPAASAAEGVQEIFTQLPARTWQAGRGHVMSDRPVRTDLGRKVFALVNRHPTGADVYMQSARDWLTTKATGDAHEYKLPAAMFEDCELVSPEWRPRLLAASVQWLHGRNSADSPSLLQIRDVLRKL